MLTSKCIKSSSNIKQITLNLQSKPPAVAFYFPVSLRSSLGLLYLLSALKYILCLTVWLARKFIEYSCQIYIINTLSISVAIYINNLVTGITNGTGRTSFVCPGCAPDS